MVGWRKFILGETGIVAIVILAIVLKGNVNANICYAIAGIAGSVSIANAIKGG